MNVSHNQFTSFDPGPRAITMAQSVTILADQATSITTWEMQIGGVTGSMPIGAEYDNITRTVIFDPRTPQRTRDAFISYFERKDNLAWFIQSKYNNLFDFSSGPNFVKSIHDYQGTVVTSDVPDLSFIFMYPTDGMSDQDILTEATRIYLYLTSNPRVATDTERTLILSCFTMLVSMIMPNYFNMLIEEMPSIIFVTTHLSFAQELQVNIPPNTVNLTSYHLYYYVISLFGIPAKGYTMATITSTMSRRFDTLCETINCASIKGFNGSSYAALNALGTCLDARTRLTGLNTAYILGLNTHQTVVLEQVKAQCKLLLSWGGMTAFKIINEFYMSDMSGVWILQAIATQAEAFKKALDDLEGKFTIDFMPYARMLGNERTEWSASVYPDLYYCACTKAGLGGHGNSYIAKFNPTTSRTALDSALKDTLASDITTSVSVNRVLQIKGLKQKAAQLDPTQLLAQYLNNLNLQNSPQPIIPVTTAPLISSAPSVVPPTTNIQPIYPTIGAATLQGFTGLSHFVPNS